MIPEIKIKRFTNKQISGVSSVPALSRKMGVALKRAFGLFVEGALLGFSLVAVGLLGQQHGLDVGQHAALRDGHLAQQLVELLVVADGQLQVAGDDARLLVVAGRVARQLQDLGRQVLQHGRQVHRGAGAHPLRVVALAQQPVDTAHGELQPGPRRARLGLGPRLPALLPAAGHNSKLPRK